ncbi:MAG: hypothetical protein VW270_01425 [Candidatus Poseidoniales archaeon]
MSYSNLILQEQTDEKKKKRRDLYRLGAAALAGGALTGGIVAKKTLTPKNLIKHFQDTTMSVSQKIAADPSIAGTPYDYKKVENMTKRGIAARAAVKPLQGALIGGGAALGLELLRQKLRDRKKKKALEEAGKDRDKDDLYYKQVNLDPYAPQYTASQLASTAGGITGGALGYTAGLAGGQKIGSALGKALGMASPIPGFGIVGAGLGGALGGALGTIGAYQLAKMARPKKKKPKKLVQYYR